MVNHQITGDRGTRPSPLSPEDLAALREHLHAPRLFRAEQPRRLVPVPSRADEPAGWRSVAPTEVRAGPAASARMVLADVEAALDRLSDGRYGRCHLCRRAIHRDRPAIGPQARYCARCRQVREAGR
ncbi:TraR/DksA family transcriptional regulator [Streptomyces sp. NPDC048187]|uniref:TraR/DksA family transcriptional regulator n=1 Tax=Streptomyces sp. NPDC048187 TaxID=3365509 RepID=UPI00371BC1D0